MNIAKNSWHYKLCNMVFNYPSKSLCIYFWQIPYSAVVVVVWCIIILASMLCVAGAGLYILAMPVQLAVSTVSIFDTFMLGTASLALWCCVFKGLNDHFEDKPWNVVLIKKRVKDKPAEKKESLVRAYLKAKKDKICPTIEFYWS